MSFACVRFGSSTFPSSMTSSPRTPAMPRRWMSSRPRSPRTSRRPTQTKRSAKLVVGTSGSLLEANEFEPAPSMVAREVAAQVDQTKRQLAQQGMRLEQMGTNEQQYAARIRPEALFNVKAFLLLDAIGKKESIEVSDEDVQARVNELAEESGQNVDRMRASMEKSGQLLMIQASARSGSLISSWRRPKSPRLPIRSLRAPTATFTTRTATTITIRPSVSTGLGRLQGASRGRRPFLAFTPGRAAPRLGVRPIWAGSRSDGLEPYRFGPLDRLKTWVRAPMTALASCGSAGHHCLRTMSSCRSRLEPLHPVSEHRKGDADSVRGARLLSTLRPHGRLQTIR